EREDRDLRRRDPRMKTQHGSRLAADLVLGIRVAEERERRAIRAGRRLDHVRQHAALVRIRLEIVDVAEILAAEFAMALQVEVGAIGDTFELALPERELVLDVRARRRVMRELGGLMLAQLEVLGANAERHVPPIASVSPIAVPIGRFLRPTEELDLHLLELAAAEREVARIDLVAERLADLSDAERQPHSRRDEHGL